MISLEELLTNPVWTRRLHQVLTNLPPDLVEYKGLSCYYDTVLTWLSQFDLESELVSSRR